MVVFKDTHRNNRINEELSSRTFSRIWLLVGLDYLQN